MPSTLQALGTLLVQLSMALRVGFRSIRPEGPDASGNLSQKPARRYRRLKPATVRPKCPYKGVKGSLPGVWG